MSRNYSTSCVSSFRVDVQTVPNIDHLPAMQALAGWAACDLKGDYRKAPARELGKHVRFNSPNEPSIVPVHQVSLPDRFNEIHRLISTS